MTRRRLDGAKVRFSLRHVVMVGLFSVAVVQTACSFGDPGQPGEVGVMRTNEGLVARVQPCGEEVILSVAVSDPPIEGSLGALLWEIRSDSGSEQRVFEIGRSAVGFIETVSLVRPLESEKEYVVTARITGPGVSTVVTSFRPERVVEDEWLISGGRLVSEERMLHPSRCN